MARLPFARVRHALSRLNPLQRHIAGIGLLCGAVCPAALSGCNQPTVAETPRSQATSTSGAPVVRVTAAPPQRQTIAVSTTQPARIEAFEVTPLYPKISGYARDIQVDIGDSVTTDAVLLAIRAPEMEHELAQKAALVGQAEAEIGQAAAAVRAAQAAVTTAKSLVTAAEAGFDRVESDHARWLSEHTRVSELAERGSVSDRLVDEAQNQLSSAAAAQRELQARVESAKAAFEESQANLAKAEADEAAMRARLKVAQSERDRMQAMLDYAEITAPFDGVVTQRNVDTGHFVQPGGGSATRPLLVIARNDKLRVVVEVPESEAVLATTGDKAVIRVPALAGREVPGEITRTSWALETSNRTLRTEIDLENDGTLRPGLYATVRINLETHPDVLAVPFTALVHDAGQTFCCLVVDGHVERRPVVIGLRSGDHVEITSGLTGDELVVQQRGDSLRDGQPVEVLPAATGSK